MRIAKQRTSAIQNKLNWRLMLIISIVKLNFLERLQVTTLLLCRILDPFRFEDFPFFITLRFLNSLTFSFSTGISRALRDFPQIYQLQFGNASA